MSPKTTPTKKVELNYEYLTREEDVSRVLTWTERKRLVVVDLETSGTNPFHDDIILMQIGNEDKQWILDCRSVPLEPFRDLFLDRSIAKLGQNFVFDLKFFGARGFRFKNVADTMVNEQVLRAGLGTRASMEALAKHYLGLDIDKDEVLRRSFAGTPVGGFSPRQLRYAAGDCVYPVFIAKQQAKIIRQRKLVNTIILENQFLPVSAAMSVAGLELDVDSWVKLYHKALKGRADSEERLDVFFQTQKYNQGDMFGEDREFTTLNYNSWQQIVKAMSRKGYHIPSTNKKIIALMAIEGQLPREFVQALLDYRMYNKRATTYGLNFVQAIDSKTGRIHPDFTQTRTSTGRLSSGDVDVETEVEDSGEEFEKVNAQNIIKKPEYRRCFVAGKGKKLIVKDYSSIEPRILGEISQDPVYVKAFQQDKDIYGEIGTPIYGEEVSKAPGRPSELRDKSKIAVLGTSYGTGKDKFHKMMLLDLNLDREGQLRSDFVLTSRQESDDLWNGIDTVCSIARDALNQLSAVADPINSQRRLYDDRVAFESSGKVLKKIVEALEKSYDTHNLTEDRRDEMATELLKRYQWVTFSESLNGRKRFFKVYHRSWWTDGRNHPIQSTAADIMKTAMVMVYEEIEERGHNAEIINQVHDELIVRCDEDDAEEVDEYVERLMIEAAGKFLKTIPVKVEGGVCDRWTK